MFLPLFYPQNKKSSAQEYTRTMKTLQEQPIGAIFLGSVATPIAMLTQNGDMAGQMPAQEGSF
jgi:hypothetical protein